MRVTPGGVCSRHPLLYREENPMNEVWKDIVGYEGRYQVSNLGNVKSLRYGGRSEARNLIPKCNNTGRLWVELIAKGKKKCMLIHRLVAMAFIPNPNNYPQINHIDENPKNNRVDNLEWCTCAYNNAYYRERHPSKPKERVPTSRYGRRLDKRVQQFTVDGNLVKEWPNSRTIALETGMSDWSISECCRGKRKTAYGYIWHYAN